MGGSTKKIIKNVATVGAFGLGTALAGPVGGSALAGSLLGGTAAVGAIRAGQGKPLIGSDLSPKIPGTPDLPDAPTTDSAAELLRQKAIQDRIMSAAFTGQGRKATIATGGQGVTKRAPLRRQTLTGV